MRVITAHDNERAYERALRRLGYIQFKLQDLGMRYLFVGLWCALLISMSPLRAEEAADAAQAESRFSLLEFRVEGNTLLQTADIERALYRYLGFDKNAQDVETARQSLAQLYSDAGYGTVLVVIPEQEVAQGVVYLQVIEGRVERTYVTGTRYFSPVRIKESVPALAENSALHLPSLQAQLTELNVVSGERSITPVLRPGRTPGTVEVELKVKDQLPLHGSVGLNDRYTLNTTRLRLDAQISYANLWQREHSLSLQYQTSPENTSEVQVYAGTYVWRPSVRSVMALYGVHSNSSVATVGALSVLGKGDIFGIRAIYPFSGGAQRITLGLDYKDFQQSVLQGADTFNTPIDYLQFSAQYALSRRSESLTDFSVGANWGMRGIVNDEREFAEKRFNARSNYLHLQADVEHERPLWDGVLRAALHGQWSETPLISNEQFSAGGVESVRGYLESELLGDTGVRLNLDMQSPPLLAPSNDIQHLYAFVFADAARLSVKDALPGQASRFDLSSSGLGIDVRAFQKARAMLLIGWPFTSAVETKAGEPRLHFSLSYAF